MPLSPLVLALVAGLLIGNFGPSGAGAGLSRVARPLLRLGVVLMGLRLVVGDVVALGWLVMATVFAIVATTLLGTRWLGRRMGLGDDLSLLVACGYAICGASAVVAVEGTTDADEREVATAIGLVTLFGTLAVAALPVLGGWMGLDAAAQGLWVGASVHDVGQVVAAAEVTGGEAVTVATLVKLSRVVLLAPLVLMLSLRSAAGVDVTEESAAGGSDRRGCRPGPGGGRRFDRWNTPVPLFVVGFLAAIAVRSTGWLPSGVLDGAAMAEKLLLAAALVGLGAGVRIASLRTLGPRPLALGAVAWVWVAGLSLVATVTI